MARIREGKVAVAPIVMKACFDSDLVSGFWREVILRWGGAWGVPKMEVSISGRMIIPRLYNLEQLSILYIE